MSLVYHILLVVLLVFTFYQDWKYRAVHWLLFPLIAIDSILIFFLEQDDLTATGLNLTFVFILIGILFFYVALREQKWTNIFRAHFGIGDVLFFIAITPLFSNQNFILFFISGMIFCMLLHVLISLRIKSNTIPLAGYLAVYLLFLKGVALLLDQDLFYSASFL